MMAVASKASAAPILCSRLLWRMNAERSRNAARGTDGRGNQDMRRKIGLAVGDRQPRGKSAVELEAQSDHFGRGNGVAAVHRRLVAPMGDEVPPCGFEEDAASVRPTGSTATTRPLASIVSLSRSVASSSLSSFDGG